MKGKNSSWEIYKSIGLLPDGFVYWVPSLRDKTLAEPHIWGNTNQDYLLRNRSLICRTREDAQTLAREMLAVAKNRKETP